MIRVLAIDPGERCGWATGTIADAGLEVQDHGISFLKDMALAVHRAVVLEDRYDVVIYETFRLTHKGARVSVGSDLQTSQVIGMIRLSAWLNPRVQLVPQTPGDKTTARLSLRNPGGEDILARLDKLPKSHDDGHDGDALLHLWNFYFKRYV